jgi:AcrR family transcriptional regulator
MTWAERAVDRSPAVQASRERGLHHATLIVETASRLISSKGSEFTTQELVKSAGVSLQTFYRYFPSKDQLILAVIERLTEEGCDEHETALAAVDDPLERLHYYIRVTLASVFDDDRRGVVRFMATEYWRLERLCPEDLDRAVSRYYAMIQREIEAAALAGLVASRDPQDDAWLICGLVRAAYHSYVFASTPRPDDDLADRVWAFCAKALGANVEGRADGQVASPGTTRPARRKSARPKSGQEHHQTTRTRGRADS